MTVTAIPNMVVIEPHADDAFLSLGGHIERWVKAGTKVTIITLFSGTRKRGRDAEAYADAVGADWVGLAAREPDAGGSTEEGRQVAHASLPAILRGLTPVGPPLLKPVLIGPVGIKHPEHVMLRKVLRSFKGYELWEYLDQPYAATKSNGEEVQQQLAMRGIISYLKPHARKYRHAKLFKDQSKFFYYNPPDKLVGNIELIVETP